jgi:hypothetical protein
LNIAARSSQQQISTLAAAPARTSFTSSVDMSVMGQSGGSPEIVEDE